MDFHEYHISHFYLLVLPIVNNAALFVIQNKGCVDVNEAFEFRRSNSPLIVDRKATRMNVVDSYFIVAVCLGD